LKIAALCFALVSVVSCEAAKVSGVRAISFVENFLTDSSLVRNSALSSYKGSPKGAVTIIGPAERCFSLSERFLSFDAFDNIDGREVPDQLPDFAGETICSIIDYANAPYEPYINANNTRFLREIFVRDVLMSMQSSCAIGPYDKDNSMEKIPSKVVIIASDLFNDYGKFDVDTLLSASMKDLPVLVADGPMTDSVTVAECFKLLRSKNLFSHRVAFPDAKAYVTCPKSGLPSEAYDEGIGAFNPSYKYTRAEDSDVDTYTLVGYSARYLSEHLDSLLRESAPQTYRSYVQN